MNRLIESEHTHTHNYTHKKNTDTHTHTNICTHTEEERYVKFMKTNDFYLNQCKPD